MKKALATLLLLCTLLALGGCATKSGDKTGISVVCTTFPQYSFVKEIVGDTEGLEITYLLESGVDIHSFQPSVKDIATLKECDVLIYVGGVSDEWTAESVGKNTVKISLMELVSDRLKTEEIKSGMQTDHHEEDGFDEHVWLSLKNAVVFCEKIEQSLSNALPEQSQSFKSNLENYLKKLNELDERYEKTVSEAKHKTLIFADRFPFRYLLDDYSIDYFAAFPGCSAESEAGFSTVVFLAEKIDTLSLDSVLTMENCHHKIAETVKENTKSKNAEILVLNSMQSVNSKENESYLSIMEKNLEVLKTALN